MKTTIAIALFILTLFCLAGCNTFSPAEVPHDQRTAVVITPESVEVLKSAIDADTQVLASSLEQIQDEGSVIFVDHSGIVYNPDGSPFVIDGKIVKVSTKVIAKLNSFKNAAEVEGVDELEYIVGGYGYLKDLPEGLRNKDLAPEALRLSVKRTDSAAFKSYAAEIVAAYAAEKGAIFQGIVAKTKARGEAFAVGVRAIGNGLVDVITATGEQIIGRINGTYAVDLAMDGVSDVIGFMLETDDGEVIKAVTEGASNVQCVGDNCTVP